MKGADIRNMPPKKARAARMRGGDATNRPKVRAIPGIARDGSLHSALAVAAEEIADMKERADRERVRAQMQATLATLTGEGR